MRKSALLLAAIAVALMASMALAGGDVKWSDASWEDILEQAKTENKYIVIDFYTTWCGPCKHMDKVTFTDASVIEFLNSTIPVKYDCDKGFGDKIADDFQVVFYPTTVVVGPDGKEVDRFLGGLDAKEYLEIIQGYTKGIGTLAWYEKEVAANPDDIELLHTLGMKHVDCARVEEAEKCFEKVRAMDPDDERGWHAEIVYSLGEANYTAERWTDSKKYFERLLEEFPDAKIFDRTLTMLARVEYKLENNDAAVATYKRYLDRHADDPSAMNGFAWFCSQRAIGLDLALPIAIKATELSNRDPGILDTLAEVYFAMGDFDNALEIGKEALATDPEDTYFNDQVKKYQKAKEDAEPQASR